jgi:hypothetical protein
MLDLTLYHLGKEHNFLTMTRSTGDCSRSNVRIINDSAYNWLKHGRSLQDNRDVQASKRRVAISWILDVLTAKH